ncbi:MAG TPA: hypothetical protein VFS43_35760 [Polyangiaceae bacterium]|nr:hypothetical protein [Polyangiaceae bacterium]
MGAGQAGDLGVLELPPAAGIAPELHLVRPAPGTSCRAASFDDRGRRWRFVEAGQAGRTTG